MEPLQPGDPERIGRYDVEGRLGTGGSGTVFLGRAPGGPPVALKLLGQAWLSHPEAPARFRREAEVLRTVRSPHTVRLIDANLAEAPYWLATEYLPGPTLAASVAADGPMPVTDAVALLAALAEGLADVHRHGICHRDLKPHNVIRSGTGPRLIDFGVARDPGDTSLTHSGVQVGTLGYAAPELLDGAAPAPAADVFALGATVAFAATGREPFGGGSVERLITRISRGEIDLDGVDPWLADVLRDCVAPDPDARPAPAEIAARCRRRHAHTGDALTAAPVSSPDALTGGPVSSPDVLTGGAGGSMADAAEAGAPRAAGTARHRLIMPITALAAALIAAAFAIPLLLPATPDETTPDGSAAPAPATGLPTLGLPQPAPAHSASPTAVPSTTTAPPASASPRAAVAPPASPSTTPAAPRTLAAPQLAGTMLAIRASGLCLDAGGAGRSERSTARACDPARHGQRWDVGDGTIRSRVNGSCLDVRDASWDAGSAVQVYPCNNTWAQTWNVVGDEIRSWVSANDGGRCLSLTGTDAEIRPCARDDTQIWALRQ